MSFYIYYINVSTKYASDFYLALVFFLLYSSPVSFLILTIPFFTSVILKNLEHIQLNRTRTIVTTYSVKFMVTTI